MKIQGEITFLINRESTEIEIRDADACTLILTISMTPDQLSSALSRLGNTECNLEVNTNCFDRIGKKHEHGTHEFKLGYHKRGIKDDDIKKEAIKTCPKGWIPDLYFGGQNSFFSKGDEHWARCTIRRYV